MRYFIPDWADTVDPSFDFVGDSYGVSREVENDVFAHELFSAPLYDGILVSRAIAEKSPSRFDQLLEEGARSFFRLTPRMRTFGDCGAFSYLAEKQPRYSTEDVLDYYHRLGVTYGASLDHLIPDTASSEPAELSVLSLQECRRRQKLTLENAATFLRIHRRERYRFRPVGVAQGWTPTTYAYAATDLLKMGYTYIALGGLARAPAETILKVVRAVRAAVEAFRSPSHDLVSLHVFGVAKPSIADRLRRLRVSSIDSASYLRKAWLRSGQNYLARDGSWYTAVRVPQSFHPKVVEYVNQNGKSMPEVEQLESYCLSRLQTYDESGLSPRNLNRLLDRIIEYDTYLLRIGDDGRKMRDAAVSKERYRKTLEARPWRDCKCEVCKRLGIHVVIFRGTNRNKRRGFHNTLMLYRGLKGLGSSK